MSRKIQVTKMLLSSQTMLFAAVTFAAPALLAQQPAPAAQAPAATAPAAQEPAPASNQAQEASEPQTLHLLVGRSLVITSPSRIKRVSLADPEIAEALVVSPTQVLVNGKKPGGVSLLVWDET